MKILNEDDKSRLYVSLLADNARLDLIRIYNFILFRVCVNGIGLEFGQKLMMRNGDRLLIGNNHFFRVNCPRTEDEISNNQMNSSMYSTPYDYNRAWLEVNADDSSTQNPIKAVDQYIEQIAGKYEEEKQAALEKQYEEFERYLHGLTHK